MIVIRSALLLVIAGSWLVTGCAGRPPGGSQPLHENFATAIRDDGSKQFEFTLSRGGDSGQRRPEGGAGGGGGPSGGPGGGGPSGPGGGPGGGGPSGGGPGGRDGGSRPTGGEDSETLNTLLDDHLAAVMEEKQFCREGYMVLFREAQGWPLKLRGECRESASDEDRQRFPDTLEWR